MLLEMGRGIAKNKEIACTHLYSLIRESKFSQQNTGLADDSQKTSINNNKDTPRTNTSQLGSYLKSMSCMHYLIIINGLQA